MQIIIDIPDKEYELIRHGNESYTTELTLMNAVANGTPLPKGHGRLIDADALMQELSVVSSRPIKSQLYILKEVPTIIEADEADFPQSEDIEPTVKGFNETMENIPMEYFESGGC